MGHPCCFEIARSGEADGPGGSLRAVAIDIGALLRRVVGEVFDADVHATYSTEQKAASVHRVRVTDPTGTRHAGLRASYEWCDLTIFDLGVSTGLFDYDGEEADKEAMLRALALVVRAYLRGEGRVERRRGWLRSRTAFTVVVDDREWVLGRRWSRPHYPD